ncbi:MAG: phenylalanine--tRNA ligase subunit beta [Bacteroidales bacterium]
MKISYNWLKEYIKTDLQPVEISGILTDTGLEVEGMELFQSVRGGLEGVVTGEVLSCRKHPDADKLSLTKVDVGNGNILQIVCGAPNVAEGQKVVVALPGTTLYKGDQSLKLKRMKIRGEVSEGMICAEDELGLGDSHEGIIVLEDETVPGTPASEYFMVENDTVFEIGLTPNRIDAASHFGVARDLAAWAGQTGEGGLIRPGTGNFKPDNNDYPIEIIVNDTENCIRYSGITISGVTVAPSPGWLQNRLKAIGLKPVNNIVDITNYVLHETGQPLHAFDADKISGGKVIVGHLPEGKIFTTLDESDRELSAEDLMICDAEGGMCIAGIFGGKGSGVNEETKNIFLESACFDPVSVRKSARRHGLNTDASFRFERGTDPSITVYVLKRAAILIKEIAGGTISSDVTDIYPDPVSPVRLEINYDYIERLVGERIPEERIKKILRLLDFNIIKEIAGSLLLEVPLYRVDVTRSADVVEEILRIYGYNNISAPKSVHSVISYTEKPDREKYTDAVGDMLSSLGFNEIISNSLTKSDYYRQLPGFPEKHLVEILNPLSNDLNSLRQTLLFGGLETVLYNANRKNPDLKLYEFGNVYSYSGDDKSKGDLDSYKESRHLALFISGATRTTQWNRKEKQSDFFDIKAYSEQVFRRLGVNPDQLNHEEQHNSLFHYGLKVFAGKKILAEFGAVHPSVLEKAGIKTDVFYADIRWDDLVVHASKKQIVYSELPRFPEVRRDLAMEIDKDVRFETIRDIAMNTEKKLLKRINLFDVYEGDKISEGKKSYAISFILQDMEGTLKDKQIDSVMNKLAIAFEEKAGARIRR